MAWAGTVRNYVVRTSIALVLAAPMITYFPAVSAQSPAPPDPTAGSASGDTALPSDYVIGPGDVLAIRFWRRDDVSGDVLVRPDKLHPKLPKSSSTR